MADKHIKRLSVACARGKRSFPPVKQKVRLRRFNEKATVKNMCNLHKMAPHEIISQPERFPTVRFHDCRAYGALLSMGLFCRTVQANIERIAFWTAASIYNVEAWCTAAAFWQRCTAAAFWQRLAFHGILD